MSITTPPPDARPAGPSEPAGPVPAILTCAADLSEALTKVRDAQPIFLTTPEKAAALQALVAVEAQVQELRLRVMAAAGDLADQTGSHDVAAWLATTTRVHVKDARREQKLATALDRRFPAVAAGMRDGAVNTAQAHVITRITGLIPDASATRLAGYLEAFTNPRLAHDTVESAGDNSGDNSGDNPAGDTAAGGSDGASDATSAGTPDMTGRMPLPKRLGRAFTQFLEAIDPRRLPLHGGDATTLIVTIDLNTLRKDLGTADLLGTSVIPDTGDPATWTCDNQITATQARRLACNAQIIPAVLGTDSEILDLGRSTRLFTRAQRRALLLRDKTCRAEGCERPGRWCEAHHADPWSHGGPTDLANAVLLCSTDHHRAHNPTTTPPDSPTATSDSTDEPEGIDESESTGT